MFSVTVSYQADHSANKLKEVQDMFYETRDYGEVCSHFGDFGLCDDAMLAWAIDLGWYLDSVLTETENALENDLYSNENPQYNFFYEIVNDAIGFIVSCLPAK